LAGRSTRAPRRHLRRGTCISTGEALTVHLADHFDATHIPLTCTTSPVYDARGQLTAVLDISALSSPGPKGSQALALQLVKMYAQHIENAAFLPPPARLGAAPERRSGASRVPRWSVATTDPDTRGRGTG
jgi:transcriptional regulator of acetoin/glycerol metabolism